MTRRFLIQLSTLWVLARSAVAFDPIPGATPEVFLGGAQNLKVVSAATSIKVFRTVGSGEKPDAGKTISISGRQCHASPASVAATEVQQVIAALSDMGNFGEALMCDFDPGVILRFESEGRHLDIVICFSCSEMILYSDGARVHRPFKWAATKNTFFKDARKAFVAIAKKAFPSDPEIQKLK